MGRRSTKTTKTGKFMNPTDQWRKQQRRRELKKNKKQRHVVREAVLRMKDVGQMLEEIEEIEKMQMTSLGVEPLPNEKGLEEKKGKLHASIHRVAHYYQIEDPKKAQELKLLIMESEKRRRELSAVYNSYRAARSQYSIDDIPLPDTEGGGEMLPSDIPMPSNSSINEEDLPPLPPGLVPPGPPSEPPPPDLPEYNVVEIGRKSVRFAESAEDHSQDQISDQSNDELSSEEDSGEDSENEDQSDLVPPGPPPGLPPGLLSAPPIHVPPPLLGATFPPRVGLPPGPPPGLPPPRFGAPPRPLISPNPNRPHIQSGAMLSAPPTRLQAPPTSTFDEVVSEKPKAIISAQPQLRNMTAEVTKFMPTSLRVRRNHPKSNKVKPKAAPTLPTGLVPPKQTVSNRLPSGATQGDAYDAFMNEMQGLL